ncbi:aminotransferase class I/II-fold pyridoxal phosphate-dependent enzyme [Xylophilus rhododendri]|uniref:Aminotransferase class I/II-fold pyridoxal phosphate-dependent enzyme n=1 Tax=Xylophilus rhododendri TaxID=2697032 RepID=A0A857J3I3_9BURK|nr:GntG family PLP-dependent aldolase [Xylophilus rhododendri]QHI98490.1 aminotransferase class I/II-fold pyridoxal phosphate-dependent enzyme [Xylophilus rhododendri]
MNDSPDNTTIDLRSDTVTLPTEAMYERIRSAPLGDDGLDGDPTAQELERFTASLLGKAAGLYTPSATMANLLAILAQVPRQDTILLGAASHIYTAERGAATFTGAFYQPLPDADGALDLHALAAALASTKGNLKPALVCVETSHNNEGGAVASLAHMQAVHRAAHAAGVNVHLDGARLFNAALALGRPAADLCAQADTVSVCLSKGLSAPMGAVLVGPEETIRRARLLRKLIGASQRQVGIAAAAGLEALDSMIGRLAEDHDNARLLGQDLAAIPGLRIRQPQTNIVQVDVSGTGMDASQWEAAMRQRRVLVRPWGPSLLRCVTHRHITAEAVRGAVAAFAAVAA